MRSLFQDARFALRLMARSPGVTAVVVATFALGIGAAVAIFSVVNAVLLRPLPYRDPDQLVRVYTQFPAQGFLRYPMSLPEYADLARDATSFAEVAGWAEGYAPITGGDEPVRVRAAYVTASFFSVLGVRPLHGRAIAPDEDQPGAPRAVVIGHGLWQRAFGGGRDIVGKAVRVDGLPMTVVGVMPPGFELPAGGVEAWVAGGFDVARANRGSHQLQVIGRLRAGVAPAQAREELRSLTATWEERTASQMHHMVPRMHYATAFALRDDVVGPIAGTLWLLQGAVILLLLLAVANVSNLLLARTEGRAKEIAVRVALGAGRRRLAQQFLMETLVLAAIGAGLGLLVAAWGIDATAAFLPDAAARVGQVGVDGRVVAFALACSLVAALLAGLAPLLHANPARLHLTLKEGGGAGGSPRRERLRRALVVGQIALAVALVVGAGLFTRSFVRLARVDPGFDPRGLLALDIELSRPSYPDDDRAAAFWERLQERVRALPGVVSATVASGLPPDRPGNTNVIAFEGRPRKLGPDSPVVDFWQAAGDGYFETIGARLVDGRFLRPSDDADAPLVVVVNESFARRFYPGERAVGKRIILREWVKDAPFQTIVGVVANVKNAGIHNPAGTEVTFPLRQARASAGGTNAIASVVVRTDGDPRRLEATVRSVVRDLDPLLPVSGVRTMGEALWDAIARPRLLTQLIGVFSGLALALAAIGVYGVMAYTVSRRTRELGIRMALGARAQGVRGLVLGQAARLVGLGVVIGLAGTVALNFALGKVLANLLYATDALDPVTFVGVAAAVLAVALAACWFPAARATRVDPMVALRQE